MQIQPTTHQLEQLQTALLDAFDHAALTRLVRFGLAPDLEWITPIPGKRDITAVVADLVVYCASQEGGLKRLFAAACEQNPNNPLLTSLASEWATLEFVPISLAKNYPASQAQQQGVAVGRDIHDSIVVTGDSNIVQQIDTGGATNIQGNVGAGNDFVGRDKNIVGDEVKGNKTEVYINQVIQNAQKQQGCYLVFRRLSIAITLTTIIIGVIIYTLISQFYTRTIPVVPAWIPSPEITQDPSAASGEVSREDMLIFASDTTDIISLDPAAVHEFSGIQVDGNVYETLVSFTPGHAGVEPLLAENWEIAEDAGMWQITFKLNPNAKFASGNPITAEDVLYSWDRAIQLNKSPAFLLTDVSGITTTNLSAVDAATFEVKIPKSKSPQVFLAAITFTVAAVVEKAVVEANAGKDMGSNWLNDHSAGSGPYVLTSWEREVFITLDANVKYWGAAPKIKRVIMQNVRESANRQAALETGDADIVQDLSREQKKALEGNPDVAFNSSPNTLLVYIGMNAKTKPFDNADVRQAVRYAINYDEIMALTGGDAELVQEIIPAGFLGHTGNNPFKQDITKARELLTKAGYPDGIEFDALVPIDISAGPIDFQTLATKVQADLEKVGMKMNIKQLQVSELLNIYRSEEIDKKQMAFMIWEPQYPDPDGNMTPFSNYAAKSIAWGNGWDSPEAAELAAKASLAATDEERIKLYAELTDLIQNQGPYAVLYQPTRIYGVRSNIDGFVFDPIDTPAITFANISKK